MNYEFSAEVKDADSGERIVSISAFSQSDLEGQWHKIEMALQEYEDTHKKCFTCGWPTSEKHFVPEAADDPRGKLEFVCGPCWSKIKGKYAQPNQNEEDDL